MSRSGGIPPLGAGAAPRVVWIEDDTLAIDVLIDAELAAGRVIVFPTDTVYGLLGSVYLPQAYRSIYLLKGRRFDKPLALFIEPGTELYRFAILACRRLGGPQGEELAAGFEAGRVTLILNEQELPTLPAEVREQQPGSVGVRCPSAHLGLNLVWATSVNRSGEPPATTADEALAWVESLTPELAELLGLVVLSREPGSGVPSRVVDLTGAEPRVLR